MAKDIKTYELEDGGLFFAPNEGQTEYSGGGFKYTPPINKNQMYSDNTRSVPTYLEKPDPVKVKEYLATKKKIEEKKKLEDAAIVQRRKDVAKQAKEDISNLKFTKAVAEDYSNNYRLFPDDANSFFDDYINPFQKSFNPAGKILENFASDAGPIDPWKVAIDASPIALELLGAKGAGKIFSPVTKAISPITKPISKFASGVKSYGKDLGYSLKNSGALPTYKNTTRWSPDVVPEWLEEAGKDLTKKQKQIKGSWYTHKPENQLGLYMESRPGPGNVDVLRMSQRQIKELENAMPEYAKGMSGKTTSLNTANDFLHGELVVPPSMRANAKSFRFDVNPSEYVVPFGTNPSSPIGRSTIGNFTNDIINSNYGNILGIPRKYFPFEEGGTVEMENGGEYTKLATNGMVNSLYPAPSLAFQQSVQNFIANPVQQKKYTPPIDKRVMPRDNVDHVSRPRNEFFEVRKPASTKGEIKAGVKTALAAGSLFLPPPFNYGASVLGSGIDFYDAYNEKDPDIRNGLLAEGALGLIPYSKAINAAKTISNAKKAERAVNVVKGLKGLNQGADTKDLFNVSDSTIYIPPVIKNKIPSKPIPSKPATNYSKKTYDVYHSKDNKTVTVDGKKMTQDQFNNDFFKSHPGANYNNHVFEDGGIYFEEGGNQLNGFKKRLMKRYPGMQGVYGSQGENLNIIKDPTYSAADYGYGNIEFIHPGNGGVNYSEDYQYQSPTPDKYTAVYNPKGANRGDVFLDMMHGMRDDKEYMKLLNAFSETVKNARGSDMQYFYEQDVKNGNGYSDGQEQWNNNYIDGQLRAQLAPGTIGMFSKGRKDYRQERKFDTPEMEQAAKDIRNYLKGKNPAQLEYGGPIKMENGTIYTNNPNDPRIGRYNDSLNLYNAYKFQESSPETDYWEPAIKTKVGPVRYKNYDKDPSANIKTDNFLFENPKDYLDFEKVLLSGKILEPYYMKKYKYGDINSNLGFRHTSDFEKFTSKKDTDVLKYFESLKFSNPEDVQIQKHASPDIVHRTIKPIGSYDGGTAENWAYKKPVQPVEYKKPIVNSSFTLGLPVMKHTVNSDSTVHVSGPAVKNGSKTMTFKEYDQFAKNNFGKYNFSSQPNSVGKVYKPGIGVYQEGGAIEMEGGSYFNDPVSAPGQQFDLLGGVQKRKQQYEDQLKAEEARVAEARAKVIPIARQAIMDPAYRKDIFKTKLPVGFYCSTRSCELERAAGYTTPNDLDLFGRKIPAGSKIPVIPGTDSFDRFSPKMGYQEIPYGQAEPGDRIIQFSPQHGNHSMIFAGYDQFSKNPKKPSFYYDSGSGDDFTYSNYPLDFYAKNGDNAKTYRYVGNTPALKKPLYNSNRMIDNLTGKTSFYEEGGMIKRADGSYSQRGLWDNIRANKGSGKKPTKEMLKQEKKIKSKYQNGGMTEMEDGGLFFEF